VSGIGFKSIQNTTAYYIGKLTWNKYKCKKTA